MPSSEETPWTFTNSGKKLSTWNMAETYFITGAQGCIGSWIVKALAERGDTIVVFDRSDDTRRLSAIMKREDLKRVHFVKGDITDSSPLLSAVQESSPRYVIHLAGLQV